jgi:hypothetical protein
VCFLYNLNIRMAMSDARIERQQDPESLYSTWNPFFLGGLCFAR